MSLPFSLRFLGGLLALLICGAATGQSCIPPLPFVHSFHNQASVVTQGTVPTAPCGFSIDLDTGAGATAAGFLHYQRPAAAASVRYGFRFDIGAIAPTIDSPTKVVQLFSASAATLVPGAADPSHLFMVWLGGTSATTPPALTLSAGCNSTTSSCVELLPLLQTTNTLRVQIDVGSGTAGIARYWLNADYSDPPTGVIDNHGAGLNNAAWGGVIAAELGLSSPSNNLRVANAAVNAGAVVFDQIETSDDLLFWHNFETQQ